MAVAPKPPAKHLRDDGDEEEEEEELVRVFSHYFWEGCGFYDILVLLITITHLAIYVEVQNTSNNNLVEEENLHVPSRQNEASWYVHAWWASIVWWNYMVQWLI